MWLIYAIGASVFAALTSILAKIGIDGVNSTLATAIRTVVVLAMSWAMVYHEYPGWDHGHQPSKLDLFDFIRGSHRVILAVLL